MMQMYGPKPVAEERADRLVLFLDGQGLASLVHWDGATIDVTHVPVFRDDPVPASEISSLEELVLVTHVARANPLWQRLETEPQVTIIWLGEQSYISGSWYDDRCAVPTWNYSALHLHCSARPFDDPQRLRSVLERTADIFEPRVAGTWTLSGSDPSYLASLQNGIVGIELTVVSHEAVFKLHQNHPPKNVFGGVNRLRRRSDGACRAIADSMLDSLSERFPSAQDFIEHPGRQSW